MPAPVLPHSLASASTVAWVIYQKYVNAVPLYRQEKDWERLGYSLSRTTMANWVIRCSEDYFSRFVARLKEEMLKEDVLHCDETYVKVLREKDVSDNSKQYMWVYRTGKHSERQIVIYDYNKSRSGDVPKTQLGKAFDYAFKRREFLGNYLNDGDCAIPNNAAENAIRPFTVGRKTGFSATRLRVLRQVLISTVS